ncbi:hypothetical protein N7471_012013 [Penicillium samsonianum]|uniref:uncharacterized protein n=1 Tax=Penicillium samsonianum TaxID=1882272 RepID=UPI00254668AB|nr:uncharacterized protein N7471_012013 [Penicillium samsonianum]KAJ6124696.1 hypothetical protein N7471_012013 [Penicillium samsonianum]
MIWRVVLLSFLFISTICALVLQTREEPGSKPTAVIHVEQSYTTIPPASDTTISTTSTDKTGSSSNAAPSPGTELYDTGPPVYLAVTSEPPDVLGIGNVSGFYGPGSWAAWFLSIVASWWRLIRASEERFDPNKWLFLLGTNWAAVGLFREVRVAQSIPRNSLTYDVDLGGLNGSIGAAFNVTFWGLFHGSMQYLLAMILFETPETRRYRLWTLLIGMILPSLALMHTIAPIRTMDVPALYWHGMHSGAYDLNLVVAAGTPYYIMPFSVWLLIYMDISLLPSMLTGLLKQTPTGLLKQAFNNAIVSRMVTKAVRLFAFVSLFVVPFSIIMINATGDSRWWIGLLPLAPLGLYLLLLAAPLFWLVTVGCASCGYAFMAYVTRSVKASHSCFFMPCSPQSINEEDQSFALFAGLLLFVGWEVIPIIVKEFRKRYRDRREFVQHMEERMRHLEMRQALQRRFGWEESTTWRTWRRAD